MPTVCGLIFLSSPACRGFNRFKHLRGIATRYDNYALTYLGGVTLAAIVIHHRTHLADTA